MVVLSLLLLSLQVQPSPLYRKTGWITISVQHLALLNPQLLITTYKSNITPLIQIKYSMHIQQSHFGEYFAILKNVIQKPLCPPGLSYRLCLFTKTIAQRLLTWPQTHRLERPCYPCISIPMTPTQIIRICHPLYCPEEITVIASLTDAA